MKTLFLTFLLLLSVNLLAEDDDHHSVHETEEFSLEPNVIKNFSIAYEPAVEVGSFMKIKLTSLVRSLNVTSIFIFEKGKFRSVIVKIENSSSEFYLISSEQNLRGKDIVYQGTNFLKTLQLALEEGPSEGHGH